MKVAQLFSSPGPWFQVVGATSRSQAATMALDPGESSGSPESRHRTADQWLYVLSGRGTAVVEGQEVSLGPGSLLLIEANERHQIRNDGDVQLQTVNLYAPPEY